MFELDQYKIKFGELDGSYAIGSDPLKGLTRPEASMPSTYPASPLMKASNQGRIFEPTALPDQLGETHEEIVSSS